MGTSKSSSDSEDTRLSDAYDRGKSDFDIDTDPYDVITQPDSGSDLNNAYLAGWYDQYKAYESAQYQEELLGALFSMLEGPSDEEIAAQEEEARIAQGEYTRDALFSDYMDAAGLATDYVNSEIANEMANARLLNIDYSVDDEQKSKRINDYFATIWGEGQQTELDQYIAEFGDPKGFTGYTVVRGDGSVYSAPSTTTTAETTIATSQGIGVQTEDDTDSLGGKIGALGA